MTTFAIDQNQFMLNGQPYRVISGAMHYFRIRPGAWRDRLTKLKIMGCNTVETYVAWNLHEPEPGKFNFENELDLVRYIQIAGELGLNVIVRPGPYICAEWEFGGLPGWLLKDTGMRLRCFYRPYLDAVERFFGALLPRLAPYQITHGGPILAMQVENEYGSYGNDKAYLAFLRDTLRGNGIDTLLFTSDGPTDEMLQYGTLPDVYKTVNFGSRAAEALAMQRVYQQNGPLMVMEFWNGWFDHWGEEHHTRDAKDAAAVLDEILGSGASLNLYMFHGGTNFGFMNGANFFPESGYQPTIGSYDYDSPLDEAGDPTPKYFAFRDVISKYAPLPDLPLPQPTAKMAYGKVELTESVSLFDALPALTQPIYSAVPEPMEAVGQNYGFILYHTQISGPRAETQLTLYELHDRAQIFINGRLFDTQERTAPYNSLPLEIPEDGLKLDILVENMGRANYGPSMNNERKGITQAVLLGLQQLFGWEIAPLPLDDLSGLRFSRGLPEAYPAFLRGQFSVSEPRDTYLALPGWLKGVVWLNGFNLGRYWNRGPQKTLYIPASLLRPGQNELIVFELHGMEQPQVELRDHPDLG